MTNADSAMTKWLKSTALDYILTIYLNCKP